MKSITTLHINTISYFDPELYNLTTLKYIPNIQLINGITAHNHGISLRSYSSSRRT